MSPKQKYTQNSTQYHAQACHCVNPVLMCLCLQFYLARICALATDKPLAASRFKTCPLNSHSTCTYFVASTMI